MNQPTIELIGCAITDEIHELDQSIAGVSIVWNITRMMKDALAGAFGAPINRPLSVIPLMDAAHTANIDWPKVLRFNTVPFVLGLPILTVEHEADAGLVVRRIVDGNHRICARQRAGFTDFDTYVVSSELEKRYRVTVLLDGVETTLPDLGLD